MNEDLIQELKEAIESDEYTFYNDEGDSCGEGLETHDILVCVREVLKNYKVYKI